MSKSLLKRTPLLPSALSAQASRGLLGIPQNRLMVKAEAMSGGGGVTLRRRQKSQAL